MPPVASGGPLNYTLPAAKQPRPKTTRVKTERPAPPPPDPGTILSGKRNRAEHDYQKVLDVAISAPAAVKSKSSGSTVKPPKSSKKKLQSSSVAATATVVVDEFVPLVALAPAPKERYASGPPFANVAVAPGALRPQRQTIKSEEEETMSAGEREDAEKQLAAVEARVADFSERKSRLSKGQEAMTAEFKLRCMSLRNALANLKKNASSRQSASEGSSRKRHSMASSSRGGDKDFDDDDEDEDFAAHSSRSGSSRKAVRGTVKKEKVDHLPVWLKKRVKMIDELARLKDAYYFTNPVDEQFAPGYYELIHNPMCLTEIRGKCAKEEYSTPAEFLKDLDLIHRNCVSFNGINAVVTLQCDALQKQWEKRLVKIDSEAENTGRRSKKGGNALKKRPPREMSWPEKEQLVAYIGELAPEDLAHVVQIVAEAHQLGDNEDELVELDIEALDNSTLLRLQEYVYGARREKGIAVVVIKSEIGADDEEFEEKVPLNKSSGKKRSRSTGGSSKQRKEEKTAAYERKPMATGPRTHSELKELANETMQNTDSAILELRDELKRMAGKVVDKDHADVGALNSAALEYSMDSAGLARQLAEQDSDDSVSSDTVSSDAEDDMGDRQRMSVASDSAPGTSGPRIIEGQSRSDADIVIENAAGWGTEEGGRTGSFGGQPQGNDDPLWERFAHRDQANMEMSKARQEHETALREEREAKEEELRRAEREKRQREEEEAQRLGELAAEKEREEQRLREEERLQRKRERENDGGEQVDLNEQSNLMAEFERGGKK